MKNHNTRSQWAGCSNFKEKYDELLQAHQKFERLLDNGYEITSVRKAKRPRISKPKTPREVEVAIFGSKVRMTFAEYQQRGQGLKVVMKIF
ncbi:MAG: hypothetical protein IJV29_07055 [Butyrivibrio sp.]|nr:hypothetical protein [Butyrivibrio sp.]